MNSLRFPLSSKSVLAVIGLLAAHPAFGHASLLDPNGGEQLQVGSQVTVRWTVDIPHNLLNWDLSYSVTGADGPWIPIATDLPAGDPGAGSIHDYLWTVPDNVSGDVRVRVFMDNVNTDYEDTSDSDLAILPALGTNYCGPAVPNSSGSSAVIHAWGSDLVVDQDFHLTAAQLPTGEFGYFLNSPTQAFVQNPGGSQGNLCLGSIIGRHTAQITNSGDEGITVIQVDLLQLPRPGGGYAVQAGETWNFQLWVRDGTSSNFTDGVSVTFG